jgi:3-methyladenine DNA glycosylase AlkC
MAEEERAPFKAHLGPAAVARIAAAFSQAHGAFDAAGFTRAALDGLDALELTPRVAHVGEALVRHLPADFTEVAAILGRVARAWTQPAPGDTGGGFAAWPLFHVVPAMGLHDFDRGMETLRVLTPIFSAEGAIRPFIDRYPEAAFERLHTWVSDPDPHVRRLVSEGTRPRLPWFPRVGYLTRTPRAGLGLLDRLVDDASLYVRRSVANHLNDISRADPELAVEAARRWLAAPSPERRWIVRHALRSLVKAGHPEVFALLGHDAEVAFSAGPAHVMPAAVPFGERVTFGATLTAGDAPARWVVDYAVTFAGARGQPRRKVFKGSACTLAAGESRAFVFAHDFRPITTRRYYPGPHGFEVLVNGQVAAGGTFELLPP